MLLNAKRKNQDDRNKEDENRKNKIICVGWYE